MVKLLIENKMEDLFQAIQDSSEYQRYLNIGNVLSGNQEINDLVSEIKKLQQKSVELEYHHDDSYHDVDLIIEKKVEELNSHPVYQEYLRRMDEFNDILAESSHQIEEYVNSKI